MEAIERNNEWVNEVLEEGEVDESEGQEKENARLRCNVELARQGFHKTLRTPTGLG